MKPAESQGRGEQAVCELCAKRIPRSFDGKEHRVDPGRGETFVGPCSDNYVAWLRYTERGSIETCDSDAPKAFRVYRWSALARASAPAEPAPQLPLLLLGRCLGYLDDLRTMGAVYPYADGAKKLAEEIRSLPDALTTRPAGALVEEPSGIDNTISITIRGQEQVACVMEALHKAGFTAAQGASLAKSEGEAK